MTKSDKEKALDAALRQLDKLGIAVPRLGDKKIEPVATVSTGSLGLDLALGCGGYPRGRIIELFGPEMSGKSTLASIGAGVVQRLAGGGTVVLIDAEHAFDPIWAAKLGVDVKNIRITQPDTGEQALEAVDKLAQSGAVDMIIVDSTAALVPKAELEADMEQQSIGLQARMLSKALRKITGAVGRSRTIVIFINQLRTNVMQMFGDPNVTPGGRALKFYSSIRISVSRMLGKDHTYKNDDKEVIGHRVKVKVVKNKCAAPFRECEFDLYFDRGIDLSSEIPQLALKKGIVHYEGKTISFGEQKWVGMNNFTEGVKSDPEIQKQLRELIINADKKDRASQLSSTQEDGN